MTFSNHMQLLRSDHVKHSSASNRRNSAFSSFIALFAFSSFMAYFAFSSFMVLFVFMALFAFRAFMARWP